MLSVANLAFAGTTEVTVGATKGVVFEPRQQGELFGVSNKDGEVKLREFAASEYNGVKLGLNYLFEGSEKGKFYLGTAYTLPSFVEVQQSREMPVAMMSEELSPIGYFELKGGYLCKIGSSDFDARIGVISTANLYGEDGLREDATTGSSVELGARYNVSDSSAVDLGVAVPVSGSGTLAFNAGYAKAIA